MATMWTASLLALAAQGVMGPPAPVPPCPDPSARLERAESLPPQCGEPVAPGELTPEMQVMLDKSLDRWLDRIWRPQLARAERVSVALGGILSIGAYQPRGGLPRLPGPPLRLFVPAGLGNSINTDPVTGKLR
jgi:hypothetical protein